jgi:hypothetical protein
MSSENPFGADNQQETKDATQRLDPSWIVGFVDGEGCFSVSVHRNQRYARRPGGWQLKPTSHVYQHEKEQRLLERSRDHLDRGKLYNKGSNSTVMTHSVTQLSDLEERITPFFAQHRLLVKDDDFQRFAQIVRSARSKEHLHPDGFDTSVRLAFSMNLHGKQRARLIEDILQGSSETIRQAPP